MADLLNCFDRVYALKLSTKKAMVQKSLELKDQYRECVNELLVV